MALFCPVTTYSVGEFELIIHFQEAYAWLFSVPLATSSVGESELIIHFQEAWLFPVPLATYTVGESELIIHFQEAYAWLFHSSSYFQCCGVLNNYNSFSKSICKALFFILATSSAGESVFIIHFQEAYA